MKLKVKKSVVIILLAVLTSITLSLLTVWNNNFAFTMDQGRDMVDIRHMVVTLSPRLVGPTTSINGVLLGPAWYYFLLPPFIIGGGSPSTLLYWQIIWYQIAGLAIWYVLSKKDKNFGLIAGLLFLFMPVGFYANRYFWNANAMLIFTAFFFAGLFRSLEKPNIKNLFVVGLLAGIAMQIEAAFGILFFPFALSYFALKKTKIKPLLSLSIGFFLTLLPQIVFEIRHQFVMTKVLLSEFTGEAAILGERISIMDRLVERWSEFSLRLTQLSHVHPNVIYFVFFASLILGLSFFRKKTNYKNEFSLSLLFLLFSAAFYLIFPQHLKGWYVLGLSIPLIIIVAYFVSRLVSSKNFLFTFLAWSFVAFHTISAVSAQLDYITQVTHKPSNDPSNLRNELAAIDWAYQEAEGGPFKAYNYIPSVYDYNYHYLYWWYGAKEYGYQPAEVAYLPNQPEYIMENSLLWTEAEPAEEGDPVFLIIEVDKEIPEREQRWLGNFSALCQEKSMTYPFGVKTIKLSLCSK